MLLIGANAKNEVCLCRASRKNKTRVLTHTFMFLFDSSYGLSIENFLLGAEEGSHAVVCHAQAAFVQRCSRTVTLFFPKKGRCPFS